MFIHSSYTVLWLQNDTDLVRRRDASTGDVVMTMSLLQVQAYCCWLVAYKDVNHAQNLRETPYHYFISLVPSLPLSLSLISIPRLIPFHSIIYFTHTRSQISSLILFHSFPALKLLQNKLNLVHFKRTRKRHASSLQLYGLIGRVRSWIGVKIWGRMAYRLPLQSLAGSRPLIPKFTSLTGSAIRGPAQLFFSPDMLSSHNSHHNNYDNNYYYCYNYNNNYQYCNAASVSYGPRLPYGALVSRIHLASQRTAVRLGKLHRVRYRTDYSAHHQNVIIIAPVLTQIN